MKIQNWHNNIVKQLSSPTQLKSDTPVCSSPITTKAGAQNVGQALLKTCPILQCAYQILPNGCVGFLQALAMLTCGASPDLYNSVYASDSQYDRQGMSLGAALRLGMVLVQAPATLTDKAQTAYYVTYGMQGAPSNTKAGLMAALIADSEGASGAKIAIAEIGKARGYRSSFGIDLNPIDLVEGAVNDVGSLISSIPGVGPVTGFFGSQVKDFANTTMGQVALTIFASVSYGALAPALGVLGPQLAAVTFAIPGMAKGDDFDKAWLAAFLDRLKQLGEYLGGEAVGDIAGQFQPAVDKIMAQAQAAGIDPATFADTMQKVGFTPDQLNKAANALGVRTDIMQEALDYMSKESAIAVDQTVDFASDNIPIIIPAQEGRTFDPTSGNATGDTRSVLSSSGLFAQPTVADKIAATAGYGPSMVSEKIVATTKPTDAATINVQNLAKAMTVVKANPPPVSAPLPAVKLHWWTRLGQWVKAEKSAKFGAETGFFAAVVAPTQPEAPGYFQMMANPVAAKPTIVVKTANLQPSSKVVHNPPLAGNPTATPAPNNTAALGQAIAAQAMQTANAAIAKAVAAQPVAKIHWWTRLANWLKRKPAAAG